MVFSRTFAGATHPPRSSASAIDSLRPRDYVAFLSYLPAEQRHRVGRRRDPRRRFGAQTRAASTFGVGPRYLHSTGSVSQGRARTRSSPSSITADDETSTAIPEARLLVLGAEARAGARRRRDARGARPADRAHPRQRGAMRRRRRSSGCSRSALAKPTLELAPTQVGAVVSRRRGSASTLARRLLRRPCAGCCRARPS